MSTSKYDEKTLIATLKERGVTESDCKTAVERFITLLPKGTLHHDAFNEALEVGVFSETNLVNALGQDQKLMNKKFDGRRNRAIEHYKKQIAENVPARKATDEAIDIAYKGLNTTDIPARAQNTKNAAGLTPTSRLDAFVETTKGVVQSARTKLPEVKPREPKPARAAKPDHTGRVKEYEHTSHNPFWYGLIVATSIVLAYLLLWAFSDAIHEVVPNYANAPVMQTFIVLLIPAILALALFIWLFVRLVRLAERPKSRVFAAVVFIVGLCALFLAGALVVSWFIQGASFVGGPGTSTFFFLSVAALTLLVFITIAVRIANRVRNHWVPYPKRTADRQADSAMEEILASNPTVPAT